jgi:hypothetical protein
VDLSRVEARIGEHHFKCASGSGITLQRGVDVAANTREKRSHPQPAEPAAGGW